MVQLQVEKPRAILFDISGTVAKSSFIDKVLMPYVRDNLRVYLTENWGQRSVQVDLDNLRAQARAEADSGAPQLAPPGAERDAAVDAAVAYVDACLDARKENKALALLRFHMWFDGYKRGRLETPVYSDVAIQLQKWRCEQSIRLYVFSNGWAEATKRFLGRTNHGDLNLLIDGHFDSALGQLTDPATYGRALERIGEPPNTVLFLTKAQGEAKAAQQAGLIVVLCLTHRRNIDKLDQDGRKMPRVRSFNEIEFV